MIQILGGKIPLHEKLIGMFFTVSTLIVAAILWYGIQIPDDVMKIFAIILVISVIIDFIKAATIYGID